MGDPETNANEGADPSDDIRKQNPAATTTADLARQPARHDAPKTGQPAKKSEPHVDPGAGGD